jgi:hypothetical protein
MPKGIRLILVDRGVRGFSLTTSIDSFDYLGFSTRLTMKHLPFFYHLPVMKAWTLGLLMISMVLLHAARANLTEEEWQTRVAWKYPAAAVLDSTFNKSFIQEYNERKASDPEFFKNPKWPMHIADKVAAKLPSAEHGRVTYVPKPPEKPSFLVSVFTTVLGTPLGIGIFICSLFVVPISLWIVIREMRLKRLLAESDAYMEQARKAQALPTVPSNLMRTSESVYYCDQVDLYETVTVSHYEDDSVRYGLSKKWDVNVKHRRARLVKKQELAHIDTGTLTITGLRFIFDGLNTDRKFLLSEIISVEPTLDGLEVSSQTQEQNLILKADNPFLLAEIIRCCAYADMVEAADEEDEEVIEDEEVSEDEEIVEDEEVSEDEEIVEDEEVSEDEEIVEDEEVSEDEEIVEDEEVSEDEEIVEDEEVSGKKREARESEEMLEVRKFLKEMRTKK